MKKYAVLVLSVLVLISCELNTTLEHVPTDILESIVPISEKYIGMPYEWGGQSFWYEDGGTVDCSGFVINVYKEACLDSGYTLLFNDTTASKLHSCYTVGITTPSTGDLIFMGEDGVVSHVAIFRRFVGDSVEFIDAYSMDGYVKIRNYSIDNEKIISFGRMLLGLQNEFKAQA